MVRTGSEVTMVGRDGGQRTEPRRGQRGKKRSQVEANECTQAGRGELLGGWWENGGSGGRLPNSSLKDWWVMVTFTDRAARERSQVGWEDTGFKSRGDAISSFHSPRIVITG